MKSDLDQLTLRCPVFNSAPSLLSSCAGLVYGLEWLQCLNSDQTEETDEAQNRSQRKGLHLRAWLVWGQLVRLLTVTRAAVPAEPVSRRAGALVAPGVVVTVLLTAVRTIVAFVDV